jgi:short-subunit dehydrogenase involved in D-alanine esterification of teichoic acids
MDSIRSFKEHLMETHEGVDILVNNAGMAFKVSYFTKIQTVK